MYSAGVAKSENVQPTLGVVYAHIASDKVLSTKLSHPYHKKTRARKAKGGRENRCTVKGDDSALPYTSGLDETKRDDDAKQRLANTGVATTGGRENGKRG